MKSIPENVSQIIKALLPLFVVIILFLFLGRIGFTKITEIRSEIANAQSDQAVLTEKLELLRTISVTGVHDSNTATNALPDANPSLLVIYQLRNLAANDGLVLTGIRSKINQSDGSDLNSISVSFNIAGEKTKVEPFLLKVATIAPVSLLSKIKVSEAGGIVSGDVTVQSFWSALPTQLPATIEGFQELTEADKQTLSVVDSLTQPTFMELPPAESSGKPNPFVQ